MDAVNTAALRKLADVCETMKPVGQWPNGAIIRKAAAELAAVRLQNESLRGVIHDEIAANTAFREAAGALPDEDMPTFCARIIRELDAARRDAAKVNNNAD